MALDCDLLVAGSGAGGLAAAVTAAHHGLRVVVAEKEAEFGGTTAWSGGWMWVPRNPLAQAAGICEDIEAPWHYLKQELGSHFDETRVRTYLEQAPRAVDFFQRHTALQFIDGNAIPDFHGHNPFAAQGGRSVCAAPFDARRLGRYAAQLKAPLPETTLWGMGIASGAELRHFMQATRSIKSLAYVTQRVLRYGLDVLLYGRGMRLVNGNALVGALAASALERGVDLRLRSPVQRLCTQHGRITGAWLDTPSGSIEVQARRGVVLACGGFPHDRARLQALLPHAPTGTEHYSAGHWGNTGDGLRLGESVGAVVSQDLQQAAALAPVSLVPRPDGSTAHFPHLIERGKPGLIAVTASGQRFANEADSYYDFMAALLAVSPTHEPVQAWLVCDHRFIRRYGLGAAKPAPAPLGHWLRCGYLQRGATLAELAQSCGIDVAGLCASVQRYNELARHGQDNDFGKGATPYNRMQGDSTWQGPNPCMAALEQGPFYAVRVLPGSLGTFAGLRVNAHAQVLDAHGQPIPGLYASGNDQSSLMGGHYPSGGITLGPALSFGYLAALHAAQSTPPSIHSANHGPTP